MKPSGTCPLASERVEGAPDVRSEGDFPMSDVMKRQARYLGCVLALGLALGCRLAAAELAWARQFGLAASDSAPGIAVDATGVYVAGWTVGALPGQVSAGGADA